MENQSTAVEHSPITLEEKQIAAQLVGILSAGKGTGCPVLFMEHFKAIAHCVHSMGEMHYIDPYSGETIDIRDAHNRLNKGEVLSVKS